VILLRIFRKNDSRPIKRSSLIVTSMFTFLHNGQKSKVSVIIVTYSMDFVFWNFLLITCLGDLPSIFRNKLNSSKMFEISEINLIHQQFFIKFNHVKLSTQSTRCQEVYFLLTNHPNWCTEK
jgi:hypothetical protein